jgi:hypothetical protein
MREPAIPGVVTVRIAAGKKMNIFLTSKRTQQ